MNRQGGQGMRGLSGFQGQQPQPNRNSVLGSGRLQNGKMSSVPSWAFGMQNGAPGLPTPQSRTPLGGSSFAQTIGGSQPAASLDLSEFPSLSGAPQSQYQNPGQVIWASQRAAQQTPVQRPQQTQSANIGTSQSQQQGHQSQGQIQPTFDDVFFGASNTNGPADDYRHGGQGGVGQLSAPAQPHPSSIDEFPPLGRMGTGEIGQDRRVNIMQNAANGGFTTASGFAAGLQHARSGDTVRQGQEKVSGPRSLQNGSSGEPAVFSTLNESQPTVKAETMTRAVQQNRSNENAFSGNATAGSPTATEAPSVQTTANPLTQMSPIDRWGLPGLLERIRSDDPDAAALAIGHDLTILGLDLNSSEPLYPTWAGPFAARPTRPLTPDFTLPACYKVHNVRPLHEKMPGFNEETLFLVFYQMTQDIHQELAAVELTHRNWRYHKAYKIWFCRTNQHPDPQSLGPDGERGRYEWFNFPYMRRETRDMTIRWEDIDDHIVSSGPFNIVMG